MPAKSKSTSGTRPLTISASALPEPQECVQPSVPCPVLRNRLSSFVRPINGIAGVAGRGPVQNCAWVHHRPREKLFHTAHDGLAAGCVQVAAVAIEFAVPAMRQSLLAGGARQTSLNSSSVRLTWWAMAASFTGMVTE